MQHSALKMLMKGAIFDEEGALRLFRQQNALPSSMKCPGKGAEQCNPNMHHRERKRNGKMTMFWQCSEKACRRTLPARPRNPFFYGITAWRHNPKLFLSSTLELIWLFLYADCPSRDTVHATGHSSATIVDCWHTCRQVCRTTLSGKMRLMIQMMIVQLMQELIIRTGGGF